jgi:glycosyltransferase involved in cell wall biosynthesis
MNKVLIITYYWPPSGGAGVQRWLKFAKYLPEFGWEPIILTIDPEYAAYPVTDSSLINDLHSSAKVYTTPATNYFSIYNRDKSRIPAAGFANSADNTLKGKLLRFIRGNFFLPDPRRGWNKYAFKKACELIKTEGINNVITTSPPHSTQLIGLKIKKKLPDIKWIADLRDPWTDIYYYKQFYPTLLSIWIDTIYEKSILKNASTIITVGEFLKDAFSLKVKGVKDKTVVVTNGFDEDDFNGLEPTEPRLFTITYTGTLSDAYPIAGFLEALHFVRNNGLVIRLRFVGTVSPNQKDLILLNAENSETEFIPYVEHETAIRFLLDTSLLLLIIPDHPGNKSIITGKIFEYIASGKPVICIGPADGDAAKIIKSTGIGEVFDYKDNRKIAEWLQKSAYDRPLAVNKDKMKYSRRALTGKIAEILIR